MVNLEGPGTEIERYSSHMLRLHLFVVPNTSLVGHLDPQTNSEVESFHVSALNCADVKLLD